MSKDSGGFVPQGKRKRVLGKKTISSQKRVQKSSSLKRATPKKIEALIKKNEKTKNVNARKVVKEIKCKLKFGDSDKADISDEMIIGALMERGTVAGASRLLDCSYQSILSRVKANPDIMRILELKEKSCLSVLMGYAIDNILKLLMEGDFNASKLILEEKCGSLVRNSSDGGILTDSEIKNKIENMTQEEREKRILELQEKLMSKKIINVTHDKEDDNWHN